MATSKKTTVRIIPRTEADLITVARNVAKTWETKTAFTLTWTTPAAFIQTVDSFENSFGERVNVKGSRSIVSNELKLLNNEINSNIQYVKNYIGDEYSKSEAPSYYAKFGISKTNNRYGLPVDNDSRLQALRQLATAMDEPAFTDKKYGKTYWQDLLQRFETAKAEAEKSDTVSTQHVSIKKELKPVIRQTLNALVLLIKANYPETWTEELRIWGFQKEKY